MIRSRVLQDGRLASPDDGSGCRRVARSGVRASSRRAVGATWTICADVGETQVSACQVPQTSARWAIAGAVRDERAGASIADIEAVHVSRRGGDPRRDDVDERVLLVRVSPTISLATAVVTYEQPMGFRTTSQRP